MNKLCEEVFEFISREFDIKPEFIFGDYPGYAVFREKKSEKWFGIMMKINGEKLGLKSGEIWILNVKCAPDLAAILRDEKRIFSAYHMNKKHWISLNLSSDIDKKLVCDLIQTSFELIKPKIKRRKNDK